MTLDILRFRIGQALLIVGPLATLAINPWSNFDPISVVKMSVISTFAFLVLFLIISNLEITKSADVSLKISLSAFLLFLFSSLLFSGAPFDQQIWGVFGRNTGVLAYLSLAVILFATAVICDINFYSKLVNVLILTALPMSFYCLVQIFGKDPIKWSSFETFGTLGNVNFLSAFLGLVCVAISALLFHSRLGRSAKLLLGILLVIDLYIVESTGSIQGLFVFAVGITVVIFIKLKSSKLFCLSQIVFLSLVIFLAVPSFAGLVNKGPLGPYLFQNSNVLRTDYWHAGLEMTQSHLIFGVGMDSYGDWYRETRGEISTLRGSPDRTANTAHNIFLDISSNGGVPLLIAYLGMLFLALRACIRVYKRLNPRGDAVFVALFSCWVGYQVQALVSINQLGVGIWGWLLTGALIGYERSQREPLSSAHKPINRKNFKAKLLPATSAIMGIAGMGLGFVLAWFPLNADSQYFSATKSRDLTRIIGSLDALGTTSWHRTRTIDSAYQSQALDKALEEAEKLVERYPRDFFGWRYILYAPNSSPELKSKALVKLHKFDPFNPEFKSP
jgi:O-antigen ligase